MRAARPRADSRLHVSREAGDRPSRQAGAADRGALTVTGHTRSTECESALHAPANGSGTLDQETCLGGLTLRLLLATMLIVTMYREGSQQLPP